MTMPKRLRATATVVAAATLALTMTGPAVGTTHAARPQLRPAAASVAVGKLTPAGCSFGAGTAACDLYAMAGTTSLLGTSVPIWGFSPTGAAGTAKAPGVALVVHQGDQVSVTLHNQLAGESVSLAFPGQPIPAGGEDTDDDEQTSGRCRGHRDHSSRQCAALAGIGRRGTGRPADACADIGCRRQTHTTWVHLRYRDGRL